MFLLTWLFFVVKISKLNNNSGFNRKGVVLADKT